MLFKLILPFFALIAALQCETTENQAMSPQIEQSQLGNTTILEATASKLIRYRSKPPPSYFRYKNQGFKRPRPRIKGPKPKYGPPGYSSYFKPDIYTSTPSYKPSYNFDDVHYEVSSEYPLIENIPLSSYENQAMDLEFYGESYSKKKPPRYEFSKPQKTYPGQRPHKVYGVPEEPTHHSYNSYSDIEDYKSQDYKTQPVIHYDVSFHEEPPSQSYGPAPDEKEEYEQFPPYGAPPKQQPEHISYQVPNNKYEAPADSYHPKEPVGKDGPYSIYDKKLPNAGYSYNNHFAEPPTDVHVIYSPAYDINPPKHTPPQNNYQAPPKNDYGPPNPKGPYQPPSDSYHPPSGGNFAEPPESYLPPNHHPDELPLKKNHMPPGYDYPKSSYEVPLYDPIPFESTTHDQDYFPPNHNAEAPHHGSESNNHVQHIAPPNPATSTATITTTGTFPEEPVPEANNKVHRFRAHNHRLNHVHKRPTTPQFPTEDTLSSEAPSSKYLDKILTTTSTYRSRRKRKRTKAPVTEKHILDVPELQDAFNSGTDQSADEPTAHSSNIKENVDAASRDTAPVRTLTDFSPSQSWNPMRIRTKQVIPQRGQRTAETTLKDLKNIEVLSIEKSHSHSYYAGTVPPGTRSLNARVDATQLGTVQTTTFKAEDAFQPTRSFVIDKTYFKAKDNEDDFYDGTGELPKNHKLY